MSPAADRRDLALLTAGVAVSTAGDAAALTALLLLLRPAGPGWVAALLAAEVVPIVVLAPIVGRVVDRFETRSLLLVALVGQAALAVPLALASAPLPTVLLFAALNALTALIRPATSALVPAVTGSERTARGYSLIATGVSLGWIAGPAAGGLLTTTLGTGSALLLDAATFALLALACAGLRARRRPCGRRDRASASTQPSGFLLLRADPVLRVALSVSALAVACAVVDNVAAPFRFIDQLGATSTGYGLYLTVWGAGALLGAQILPLLGRGRAEAALAAGNALSGVGIAGIGFAPTVSLAFVAAGAGGIGNGLSNVAQNTLISSRTSPGQEGRAFAAAGALIQLAIGAGTTAGAPLVRLLHADGTMLAAGGLTVVPALVALPLALHRHNATPRTAEKEATPVVP